MMLWIMMILRRTTGAENKLLRFAQRVARVGWQQRQRPLATLSRFPATMKIDFE